MIDTAGVGKSSPGRRLHETHPAGARYGRRSHGFRRLGIRSPFFAATYLEGQTQKIEGDVIQFLFRNPHSFLHVEATDDKGVVQRWAIEWGGGGQLGRQGVTRESLKAGDRVIIVGQPGRNPDDHRLRMVNITRPSDGWKWGGSFD